MLEAAWVAAVNTPGFTGRREFVKLDPVLSDVARQGGYRYLLESAEQLSQHGQKIWGASGSQVKSAPFALADALEELAPHVPNSLVREAFEMVDRMSEDRWRWVALCHLLPRLSGPVRETAMLKLLTFSPEGVLDRNAVEFESFLEASCRGLLRAIPTLDGAPRDLMEGRLREMLRIVDAAWLLGLTDTVAQVLDSAEVADLAERALACSNSSTTVLAASLVIPAPRRWALCLVALLEGTPPRYRCRLGRDGSQSKSVEIERKAEMYWTNRFRAKR